MQISFSGVAPGMAIQSEDKKDIHGYFHASYQMIQALSRAGFDCSVNSSNAPLSIAFSQPGEYLFYPNQYKIGYTAWESTEIKKEWEEGLSKINELWATSSWTAEVFKSATQFENIHVYPHGIDMSWKPKKRTRGKVFTFLHIGEPQVRKNGQLVVDAFIKLFGNDENFQLILKCSNINTTRIFHDDGSIAGGPDSKYKNIKIITQPLSHEHMVSLFHESDALIYPTMGEGFGFIPLQALATGMPVATTAPWAEYKKFITVPVDCQIGPSEYPEVHPGKVFNVTQESVENSMTDLYENYEKYNKESYKNSFHVHMEYNWDRVTKPTAERLRNIFKTRGL